ncbi:hypothetical protein Sj15T_10010 [Sphingobium sp. TA15]|uniref:Uncharacterized protein n=1 Tax=Sphingobium indicum (strain DSM 16413 / CCM 7287 / MTCC 6362 / UT26 / NBRC 101211 / UT26S) TaxID=452662 RepID=D4Z8S2_SPHIU|nr:hypothetical protein SJA_P1-00520 [Sphingobium indicum UT26S]BDD65980.1 hypothetical protein Sj15T_10010 [Sphingobium sp. TA15]
MSVPFKNEAGDHLRRLEHLAIARHLSTGVPHCIVQRSPAASPVILPEADVIAGGPMLIDSILWSTDTAETDGFDPALLA